MRTIFTFFAIYILSIVNSHGQPEHNFEIFSLKIEYETGCFARISGSLLIIEKDGDYFASKLEPNYYYGTRTDSVWTLKLDSVKINTIYRFVDKAKQLEKSSCPSLTTSIDHYLITINEGTSIRIVGNCEWNGLNYNALEKIIFKEKFEELEFKRNSFKDSIRTNLEGIWKVSGLKQDLKRYDLVILYRTPKFSKSRLKTIWSFTDSIDFKSHTNNIIDLKYSTEYWLIVSYGYVSLTIRPGYIENEGKYIKKNDGLHFMIKKMETDKITLEYWGM